MRSSGLVEESLSDYFAAMEKVIETFSSSSKYNRILVLIMVGLCLHVMYLSSYMGI